MLNNHSTVTFIFEVGQVHNRSMSLTISTNKETKHFKQVDSGVFKCDIPVFFPDVISINVSGKGPNDTLVDDRGNIVGDMYIKLNKVFIDGIPSSIDYVHKLVIHTDNGNTVTTNYWGFNGTIKLNLLYKNVMFWAMNHSKGF